MKAKTAAAGAALAVAACYQPVPVRAEPLSFTLVAAAVGLTLIAPTTPIGTFPSGAVFFLLLTSLVSPALAAAALGAGFLLWSIVYSDRDRVAEFQLNGLPLLSAAAVANLFLRDQPDALLIGGIGLVYLLALNLSARRQAQRGRLKVAWQELRWAFLRSTMIIPLLFAMGHRLLTQNLGWLLPLAVVSWFQSSGAVTELVRSQLKPMSSELKSAREREKRWVDRLTVLGRLSKRLTAARSVDQAVAGVRESVEEYCPECEVKIELNREAPPKSGRYPLADAGYLEVLGPRNEEQDGLLSALATTAGFAIRMVTARQQQYQSLQGERDQMESWLSHLRELLRASQSLASALTVDSVLQRADSVVQELVPHRRRAVVCFRPRRHLANAPLEQCETVLSELQNGGEGRFQPNLLSVPVVFEGVTRGALVLGGENFSKIEYELLRVLAYQLGGAFERARLYDQVVAAEQQMIQASKMAAVGQLAAGIAHELNTPLGTMMMAIEYAQAQPDKARQQLQLAHKSGAKARGIIAKLLHYSTEATLEDQSVELSEVLHDVASGLKFHLDREGVVLKLEIASEPRVKGNKNEIHQVVSNLLQNGLEAVASGSFPKNITARLWQDGERAYFSVLDRGPGLSPEAQERMFEPFFSEKEKHTGLGLSVAHQLVRKHGGEVRAQSGADGTLFTVALPAIQGIPETL